MASHNCCSTWGKQLEPDLQEVPCKSQIEVPSLSRKHKARMSAPSIQSLQWQARSTQLQLANPMQKFMHKFLKWTLIRNPSEVLLRHWSQAGGKPLNRLLPFCRHKVWGKVLRPFVDLLDRVSGFAAEILQLGVRFRGRRVLL